MQKFQLEQLFAKLRGEIYRSSRHHKRGMKSPRFDTSDIAQDGLLKLWEKYRESIEDFHTNATFISLVSSNVTANTIRYHSAAKRSVEKELVQSDELPAQSENDPRVTAERAEGFRRMLEALAGLTPEKKRAFEMFAFNEATYQEIADELDVTIQVVRTLIKNAKKEMRNKLEDLPS